jgi:hypothetical protein
MLSASPCLFQQPIFEKICGSWITALCNMCRPTSSVIGGTIWNLRFHFNVALNEKLLIMASQEISPSIHTIRKFIKACLSSILGQFNPVHSIMNNFSKVSSVFRLSFCMHLSPICLPYCLSVFDFTIFNNMWRRLGGYVTFFNLLLLISYLHVYM